PSAAAARIRRRGPKVDPSGEQAERAAAAVAAEQAALERERESRNRLVELDRHKSEFISSVSHELRTPLTSISGYLELLMDGEAGPLTDQQHNILAIIDRNSRRLLALLDGLLTLSRLDAGTLSVRIDPVDVSGLVDAVLTAAAPALAARSLTLETELAPDLGIVHGDAVELERALENVVTNAIEFTEPGGRVSFGVQSTADSVVLAVADTGVGIPAADRAKLFTRFFRSGSAQEKAIQGTGLGLVIVKGIIDSHHGDITIASTPGCGTTVTIRLPRQYEAPAPAPTS
ncbi:MAG: HAMP domain-containing sensor histidine kinase, partial [Frankiaceae bacterium]